MLLASCMMSGQMPWISRMQHQLKYKIFFGRFASHIGVDSLFGNQQLSPLKTFGRSLFVTIHSLLCSHVNYKGFKMYYGHAEILLLLKMPMFIAFFFSLS